MTTVPLTPEEEARREALRKKYEGDSIVPTSFAPYFPIALVGVLFLGIYYSTFLWMANRWIVDPSATHGWLVIPITAAVTFYKWPKLRRIPLSSHKGGLWLMALALLMHSAEKFFDINGPSPLSIPIFLSGAVWYFAGTAWLIELAFPLAYLLFMVPIPGFLNQFVSFPLRLVATNGAKMIVEPLGINIAGAGMNMEFWRPGSDHTNPERDFVSLVVADPCSGLHSLMAIKALHAITAYLSKLRLTWKWVLFWCALPISMAANVLRMVSIILVCCYIDKAFGLKAWHDYSPYLLFAFVFGILFFVGILMEFASGAYRRKKSDADTPTSGTSTGTGTEAAHV
jgi:exosortase